MVKRIEMQARPLLTITFYEALLLNNVITLKYFNIVIKK